MFRLHARWTAVAVLGCVSYASLCSWSPLPGLTYDVASLQSKRSNYDIADASNPELSYVFNVCANVTRVPSPSCGSAPAGAFQLNAQDNTCYTLGQINATSFMQLDPQFPERGVIMRYDAGESVWCPKNGHRTFQLVLLCAPVPPTGPSQYTSALVVESTTCTYSVVVASLAGCPTQCVSPSSSDEICSGHGACGFDTDASAARCFCFDGYSGTYCDNSVSREAAVVAAPRIDAVAAPTLGASPCKVSFPNMTVDLTPMNVASFYAVSSSLLDPSSADFQYAFNFCGNTGLIPDSSVCNTTYPGTGGPDMPLTNPAGAFQIAMVPMPARDQCHRRSTDLSTTPGAIQTLPLYDFSPARALRIEYIGGDIDPTGGRPRGITFYVLCDRSSASIPAMVPVFCDPLRGAVCQPVLELRSVFACPRECPAPPNPQTGVAMLCSGHGVCDIDGVLGVARCFCNTGWNGTACDSQA